jgi:lipopolysaccharide export system permease protein
LKQRDPNIVQFDRYAFDLSQFANGPLVVRYTVRERYLWQLFRPNIDDPRFREQPGQFRAELHDRLLAPVYPFAFVLIAYAFLGAPRITRQSAAWSMTGVAVSVATLRLIGFASTIFTLKYPAAAAFQYVAVAGAIAASLYAIARGVTPEPPAVLIKAVEAMTQWFMRRAGAVARLAP